ncbi:hypothetical protein NM688_g7876 [Phlebia brevispora]|uniref:Uncharacterized protein n=1 Tax=Phlebia brevispora TaxID=194682 RepID=A0ACC1S070_9APHY|nr:hypothetical protein NM688_g7876 [Phlebia brevispora]
MSRSYSMRVVDRLSVILVESERGFDTRQSSPGTLINLPSALFSFLFPPFLTPPPAPPSSRLPSPAIVASGELTQVAPLSGSAVMDASPSNSSAKAELIGTYLETLTYGVYLVVFYKCLTVLGAKYVDGRPTCILLCTALSIFALVTVHLIMDILRAVEAYTTHMDVPYAPIYYYAVVRRDLDLIKSGCYIATTIIADGIITYRTHIVWARNFKLTLIPFLLVLADIGTGTYALWLLNETKPGDNALLSEVTIRVRYFYAVTLALNLLCSGLISFKIWRVQREVDRYFPSAMRPNGSRVILTIIESVTSIVGTPAVLGMLDVVRTLGSIRGTPTHPVTIKIAPCIGIVFSMVIVCVTVDRTRWDSLKITTHLNFVSSLNMSTTSADRQAGVNSSVVGPNEDKVPVKVEHHVQGATMFTYSGTESLRAGNGSTASLPDLFV